MHRPVGDALASVLNSSSEVYSGATLTFYSLADVLQEVYTDTDWVTPASTAGVLTANSSGRFPKAYFKDTLDYKAVLKDSSGTTIVTINPIYKAAGFLDSSDLTPYLPKAGGTMTGALNLAEGAAIPSASAIDLDAATGNMIHITGTTTIDTITLAAGRHRWCVFDGALTLTHSSNLVLPGSLNITTVAGDMALFIGEGSGVTRCFAYSLVSGKPLIENAEFMVGLGNESDVITTGATKLTVRAPFTMYLDALPTATLTTASSSGVVQFDINQSGVSIFSTVLSIDANETTSATAATAAVLTSTPYTITYNNVITIDIDDDGTNAAGPKILLRGYRRNR